MALSSSSSEKPTCGMDAVGVTFVELPWIIEAFSKLQFLKKPQLTKRIKKTRMLMEI